MSNTINFENILKNTIKDKRHEYAGKQSQLLERFKKLREWQTEQQNILLKKQQEQLHQLHLDREAATRALQTNADPAQKRVHFENNNMNNNENKSRDCSMNVGDEAEHHQLVRPEEDEEEEEEEGRGVNDHAKGTRRVLFPSSNGVSPDLPGGVPSNGPVQPPQLLESIAKRIDANHSETGSYSPREVGVTSVGGRGPSQLRPTRPGHSRGATREHQEEINELYARVESPLSTDEDRTRNSTTVNDVALLSSPLNADHPAEVIADYDESPTDHIGSARRRLLSDSPEVSHTAMVRFNEDAAQGVCDRPTLVRRPQRGLNTDLVEQACQLTGDAYEEVLLYQDRTLDAEDDDHEAGRAGVVVQEEEEEEESGIPEQRDPMQAELLARQLHAVNERNRRISAADLDKRAAVLDAERDRVAAGVGGQHKMTNGSATAEWIGSRLSRKEALRRESEILAAEENRINEEAARMSGGVKVIIEQDEGHRRQVAKTSAEEGDDRPIQGSQKAFENIVNEQLGVDKTNLKSTSSTSVSSAKRPYLRRSSVRLPVSQPRRSRSRGTSSDKRPLSTATAAVSTPHTGEGPRSPVKYTADGLLCGHRTLSRRVNEEKASKASVELRLLSKDGGEVITSPPPPSTKAIATAGEADLSVDSQGERIIVAQEARPLFQEATVTMVQQCSQQNHPLSSTQTHTKPPTLITPSFPINDINSTSTIGYSEHAGPPGDMDLEEFEILEQLADDDASNFSNMSIVNKIMKRKLKEKNQPPMLSLRMTPGDLKTTPVTKDPVGHSSVSDDTSEKNSENKDGTHSTPDASNDKAAFEAQMREIKDCGAKMISNREIYSDAFNATGGQRIVVGKKATSPSAYIPGQVMPTTVIKKPTPPLASAAAAALASSGGGGGGGRPRPAEYNDDTSTLCGASPSDGAGGNSEVHTASLVAQYYQNQAGVTASAPPPPPQEQSPSTNDPVASGGSGGEGAAQTVQRTADGGSTPTSSFPEDRNSWKNEDSNNKKLCLSKTEEELRLMVINSMRENTFPDFKIVKAKGVDKSKFELDTSDIDPEQEMPPDAMKVKFMRGKVDELENEIGKFKTQNQMLLKITADRDKEYKSLQSQIRDFEEHKNLEIENFKNYKIDEIKKLRKEKKIFDDHQASMKLNFDKAARQEHDILKNKMKQLQEEMNEKEQRNNTNIQRLKGKLKVQLAENAELKKTLQVLEDQRINSWQNKEKSQSSHHHSSLQKNTKKMTRPISNDAMNDSSGSNISEETEVVGGQYGSTIPTIKAIIEKKRQKSKANSLTGIPTLNLIDYSVPFIDEIVHDDGRVEKVYSDGSRETLFQNGTRKQISAGNTCTVVQFFNGDVKQINEDGRIVYYYSDAQTTHTTYADETEVLNFASGQTEKHFPSGIREIHFPDKTIKTIYNDGSERSVFADGTNILITNRGRKEITFSNGQKEIHTADFKRREYPDGTCKTIYPDGKQETLYANGRLRIKDAKGTVILDKRVNFTEEKSKLQ